MRKILGVLGLCLLACAGLDQGASVPEAVPVAEPEAPVAPREDVDARVSWPLGTYAPVPETSTTHGTHHQQLAVSPDCTWAVLLTDNGLLRWDFAEGEPARIDPLDREGITSVAFSAFDGALWVAGHLDGAWAIQRWRVDGLRASLLSEVYRSEARVSDLVVPFVMFDGAERAFFARGESDPRIMSVIRDGSGMYEVTSPTGALTSLSAREYRDRAASGEEWGAQPPNVLQAASARPVSMDPERGDLYWRDGDGGLHRYRWGDGNWATDEPLDLDAAHVSVIDNGSLLLAWGHRRTWWLDRDLREVGEVAGPAFVQPPTVTPHGRALVGVTDDRLVTRRTRHPLASVRFWERARHGRLGETAAQRGIAVGDSGATQLFEPYEAMSYEGGGAPTWATIDGLLEVLHAGFEAAFMTTERQVSTPALRAFATELKRAAAAADSERVASIAGVALDLLDGRHDHPEAKLVLAGASAESALHGRLVDFGDAKPRGPYDADDGVRGYFRAFKYLNLLALTDEEREALRGDAALVDALGRWQGTQAPFLMGSRQQGLLTPTHDPPTWVRPGCLPPEVPSRLFPLNWPLDSEILDRTTAHDRLPEGCGVPTRGLPTGLDLLTGLGSAEARRLLAPSYARYPALEPTHDALVDAFADPISLDGVVPAWLRVVQLLSTDTRVPEGVAPAAWRSRLLETSLASWTSLRHTMILLNEVGVAEMGDGGPDIFEELTTEPARGVVDPVPEAWDQLASTLAQLSDVVTEADAPRVRELLAEASANARDFGDMARRQMAGEALSLEEYGRIDAYGRAIEHPFLVLKAAAVDPEDALKRPDPMSKIVDVYTWAPPGAPPQHLHVAVGLPRTAVALLGDRGLRVPATGAVYSYYEVVDTARLSDEDWRKRALDTEPPRWSLAHPSWSP